MTRDEAIEIEKQKLLKLNIKTNTSMHNHAVANIDALIELGLLKVEAFVPQHLIKLAMHMGISPSQLEASLTCLKLEIVKNEKS